MNGTAAHGNTPPQPPSASVLTLRPTTPDPDKSVPLVWGAPCQGQSAGGTLFPAAPRTGPWLTTGGGPPNLVSGRLASSRTLIPHPARSSAQADGTRLLDGG